jgi:hypothetical protein
MQLAEFHTDTTQISGVAVQNPVRQASKANKA